MNDPSKKVKNTLFNASVTGATYEDFSQNAVIMPAMEKPPPPIVNITADSVLQRNTYQEESAILEPVQTLDSFPNSNTSQPPSYPANSQPQFYQPPYQEPQEISFNPSPINQTTSKVSSVLSSFSSYLKLGGSPKEPEPIADIAVPAPAGLDNFINQDNTTAPPVPLFSSSGNALQSEVPKLPSGPVNTFRRPGLKRAVYAPPPGLTGVNTTQVPPPLVQPPPVQTFSPPQQYQGTSLQPQPIPSPPQPPNSSASVSEINYNLPNQFKPISPLPSNFSNILPQVPYPQHSQNLFGAPGTQLGPVMDAIPDNEALTNQSSKEFSVPDGAGYSSNVVRSNTKGSQTYRPVYHHWFYNTEQGDKVLWQPFSMLDSLELEQAFTSNDLDPDKVTPTDGGRYDVNILRRQRTPVYWAGKTSEVRRCSWFYKNHDGSKYAPYEENVATRLEEEYKIAFESKKWQRKVELGNGETVIFHGPETMVLFPNTPTLDIVTNSQAPSKPRVVKRGMDEFHIDEGESTEVDHLLFMVHGIGSVCDLKFRTVEQVVDDFRVIALQLVQSHYKSSCEKGLAHRVEVLPINWHDKLHQGESGIDKHMKNITLESIPKLREFTNDTILDVLLYTSPVYCQNIISSVGDELNRIFDLFQKRNPSFKGAVSLAGHSLGSLILFDLLSHQRGEKQNLDDSESADSGSDACATDDKKLTRRISYMMGSIGAGQPKINYPHLRFHPRAFFALGSPIGMFITVRGLDQLGEKFALPTCSAFFNIFHPYDPVAYRIEALINPELSKLKPVLIPHHKGRKRMHLELKETMARVGADLKQKVFENMKTTFNSFFQLSLFSRQDEPVLESEVNKSLQKLEISEEDEDNDPVPEETDIPLGKLNMGRRIDYILQEAPLEFFNEYIFALTSHVCYWDSEDTALLILKEIYNSMNIPTDDKIPQQSMTIERPSSSFKASGMDPNYPIKNQVSLPPPPTSGFMRKS